MTRKIEFLPDVPYSNAEGIVTFRGNNYRDSANYGIASVLNRKLEGVWSVDSGLNCREAISVMLKRMRLWSGQRLGRAAIDREVAGQY